MNPSGQFFALSTTTYIRVFHLGELQNDSRQSSLMRLRIMDEHQVIPNTLWHLHFQSETEILGISADGRRAIFLIIQDDLATVQVSECVPGPCCEDEQAEEMFGIDRVAVSENGKFICIGSNNSTVVYQVIKDDLSFTKVCSVPSYFARLTSMTFHPERPVVLLTFSDNCIQVYDFRERKIVFCEKIKKKFDDLQPILGSAWIDDGNAAAIFQADSVYLLKMVLNEEPVKKSRKSTTSSKVITYDFVLKSCEKKYRYIAHIGRYSDSNNLLAVEVNPNSIIEKLPASFARKRFGT